MKQQGASKLRDLEPLVAGYEEARETFGEAVNDLVALSVSNEGLPSRHGREFWAFMLVTKLTITSMTLNKIAPKSIDPDCHELWDLTSVSTLARVLVENYLMLVWLCVETKDQDIWDFRITALTIVDNRARYRLTQEIEGSEEPEDFKAAQAKLGDRLSATKCFGKYDVKKQRELLRGNKMPFIQDDVFGRLQMDRPEFRKMYRYLSSFVHTNTISFFRMADHNRGKGEFNTYEAATMSGILSFAAHVIENAIEDVHEVLETVS
jgi:hypothetical protein